MMGSNGVSIAPMRQFDDVRTFQTSTYSRREGLRSKLPAGATDPAGRLFHFWSLREGEGLDKPIVIALPRSAYSAELWGEPGDRFDHMVIFPAMSLPEIVFAALPGQAGGKVFDHWMFAPGTAGCAAIVKRARMEAGDEGHMLVLMFDRAVHPSASDIRMRLVEDSATVPRSLTVAHFLHDHRAHLWSKPDHDFDDLLAAQFSLPAGSEDDAG